MRNERNILHDKPPKRLRQHAPLRHLQRKSPPALHGTPSGSSMTCCPPGTRQLDLLQSSSHRFSHAIASLAESPSDGYEVRQSKRAAYAQSLTIANHKLNMQCSIWLLWCSMRNLLACLKAQSDAANMRLLTL